jgi:hypothetical protein
MQGCCLPFRVQDASITTADIQVERSPADKTSENRSSAKPRNREKAKKQEVEARQ